MQAAAMQLPCIVTNIDGYNEIIKHQENGVIVPVKDKLALFKAMESLFNHREEVEGMGKKSRELMKACFERKLV